MDFDVRVPGKVKIIYERVCDKYSRMYVFAMVVQSLVVKFVIIYLN